MGGGDKKKKKLRWLREGVHSHDDTNQPTSPDQHWDPTGVVFRCGSFVCHILTDCLASVNKSTAQSQTWFYCSMKLYWSIWLLCTPLPTAQLCNVIQMSIAVSFLNCQVIEIPLLAMCVWKLISCDGRNEVILEMTGWLLQDDICFYIFIFLIDFAV